jgi:hypothetical protein
MNGPRALIRRGVAILRLEGQHTGGSRFPAARLDIAGLSQESIHGGREGEDGRGVLTTARRCSRGRLEVVVHVGAVDVPGGDVPSIVWTSLGPLPRWVPGPTTRWATGTTRLVPHST